MVVNKQRNLIANFLLPLAALLATTCISQSLSSDQPSFQVELNRQVGSIEILDESALSVIDPTAAIVIRAEGFKWTEGPLWIADGGYLLFSDIPNNVINRYDPGVGTQLYLAESGFTGLHPGDSAQGSNGLLLDSQGRLVLFQQGDRRVAVMEAPLSSPLARYSTLAGSYHGKRLNSPNDGVYHSDGILYFTDPPYGLTHGLEDEYKQLPHQGIYRLRPDGTVDLLDDTVSYPNGIALSTDEQTLYVAVSDDKQPMWLAYDVLQDGMLENKRIFYDAGEFAGYQEAPGLPDGMAVHSSGNIFATGPGGVWVFGPSGRVLAKILTGKATANCSLSTDEQVLFMTAHDTLMTVQLPSSH